jgi:tetratricopeptide (TPR) repeat protein
MRCPSCNGEVTQTDWLCPYCEHVLDPSVLGVDDASEEPASNPRAERTKIVAWDTAHSQSSPGEQPPDAMILGDVDDAEPDFSVVHGPAVQKDGRTSTFLFYTSGATSRIIHPDAIPVLTQKDATIPHTPYEDFIVSCIDGKRSVRAIQRASGLAPQEVVITLLTLMDKGVIRISKTDRTSGESEPTVDGFAGARSRAPDRGPVPDSDIDDLPSVSDVRELRTEEEQVSGDLPGYEEESPTAEVFEGDLKLARGKGRDPSRSAPEDDDSPVMPSALDASDSEMVTDHSAAIPNPRRPSSRRRGARGRSQPSKPPKDTSDLVRPVPPLDSKRSRSRDPPTPPPKSTASVSSPPPVLEAEFLVEVERSKIGKAPKRPTPAPLIIEEDTPPPQSVRTARPAVVNVEVSDEHPSILPVGDAPESESAKLDKEDQRRVLEKAVKRAPIEERDRRTVDKPRPKKVDEVIAAKAKEIGARSGEAAPADAQRQRPTAPPPQSPSVPVQPAAPKEQKKEQKPAAPVDGVRMAKAQKLFDEALKDRAEGNLLSAKMNMKLALTFDPGNEMIQKAFDDLNKSPGGANLSPAATKSRARELYDQATERENAGDVDEAIALLEKALHESKEPAFYNRLGVMLAMKKRDFVRAQQLIETAISMAPSNTTYQHNLGKVLSMAAVSANQAAKNAGQKKGGGILGFLGRKK